MSTYSECKQARDCQFELQIEFQGVKSAQLCFCAARTVALPCQTCTEGYASFGLLTDAMLFGHQAAMLSCTKHKAMQCDFGMLCCWQLAGPVLRFGFAGQVCAAALAEVPGAAALLTIHRVLREHNTTHNLGGFAARPHQAMWWITLQQGHIIHWHPFWCHQDL